MQSNLINMDGTIVASTYNFSGGINSRYPVTYFRFLNAAQRISLAEKAMNPLPPRINEHGHLITYGTHPSVIAIGDCKKVHEELRYQSFIPIKKRLPIWC